MGGQETDADAQSAGDEPREALAATLLYVLRRTVALAHPVIPFVTEELWRYLEDSGDLLAGCAYPCADGSLTDLEAEVELERAIEATVAVRGWRDSVGAHAGASIPARLCAAGYEATAPLLARMARLTLADIDTSGQRPAHVDGETPGTEQPVPVQGDTPSTRQPAVASVAIPGGTIEILSAEGLDLDAAERRRSAAKQKLRSEIERVRGKLENPGFIAKAPAAVVEGERERLRRLTVELEAL